MATTAVAQQPRPCTEGSVVAFAYIRAKPGMFDKWNAWSGRADRASAVALARRTGAGLVLFGALERRGSDSVGIRAALLEVGGMEAPLEVEVRGDTLGLANLVDSLAIALLPELGRTVPWARSG